MLLISYLLISGFFFPVCFNLQDYFKQRNYFLAQEPTFKSREKKGSPGSLNIHNHVIFVARPSHAQQICHYRFNQRNGVISSLLLLLSRGFGDRPACFRIRSHRSGCSYTGIRLWRETAIKLELSRGEKKEHHGQFYQGSVQLEKF